MTTQQQPTTTNTRAAGHFSRPRCSVSAGKSAAQNTGLKKLPLWQK